MPHSDLHKRKLKKNLFILAAIMLWCLLIFMVSLIKMAHAQDMPVENHMDNSQAFYQQRAVHNHNAHTQRKLWYKSYENKAARLEKTAQSRQRARMRHMNKTGESQLIWDREYNKDTAARAAKMDEGQKRREAYLGKTADKPEQWWEERAAD